MRINACKGYPLGQLLRLSLVLLVLVSSLSWSVVAIPPALARSVSTGSTSNQSSKPVKVKPTDASQLQFGSAVYTATEGQAGTLVTVNRTGSSSGAVTATVVFTDVTTYPTDYQFSPTITAGHIDAAFNSGVFSPSNSINKVVTLPDDKLLVAGTFATYNGVAVPNLMRLNSDGSLDPTFNPGGSGFDTGAYSEVEAIAALSDNKILVAGNLHTYNGVAIPGLIRLNVDGSLDPTFNPGGAGPSGLVLSIAVQSTGKIFITGGVYGYNGVSDYSNIIYLYPDGTQDMSYMPVLIPGGPVRLAIQPDDKVLVGSVRDYYELDSSGQYHAADSNGIIRLNPDGKLDTSFDIPATVRVSYNLNNIIVQKDGKILVTDYLGYIQRFNADGTVDNTFHPNLTHTNSPTGAFLQSDGKIVLQQPDFFPLRSDIFQVRRLNPDGSLDTSLNFNFYPNSVQPLEVQSGGQIILGTNTTASDYGFSNLIRLRGTQAVTLSWPDGDSSPRSLPITATDDNLYEPTENLELGLTDLQGGATGGSQVTTTLSIISDDYPSQINLVSGTNQSTSVPTDFAQPLSVQVLTQGGTPIGNVPVTFVAPSSGPSAAFAGSTNIYTDTTDVNGYINTTKLTANSLIGSYTVTATATGVGTPVSFVLTNTVGTTSMFLVNSPNPSIVGQAVAIKAFVIPAEASGTVTFTDGSNLLGTASVINGMAVYTVSNLSIGNHAIGATYSGDANYFGSTAPILTQVVQPISTTFSLVSDPNPSIRGHTVTFTATVSPFTATGTVTFTDGATVLSAMPIVSGTAVYTTSSLSMGSHLISATYGGDANYGGASRTITQVVQPLNTTLSLVSNANPSEVLSILVFTATVSPATATGTVIFTTNTAVLGTAPLVNGIAVYRSIILNVGSHVIGATYYGDATYAGSTAPVITQVVAAAACQPLVVTSITDDGAGLTCGTLSYALSHPAISSKPFTITFALTQGNTITFTGSLTTTASLKAYGVINGGAVGSSNRIIINGNGVSGDGLHLRGRNTLTNLTIEGFGARQLVQDGAGNVLQGVKVIS